MNIRERLKKNSLLRGTVLKLRSVREEFRQNPDTVEWLERAFFSLTHGRPSLPPATSEEIELIKEIRSRMAQVNSELPTPSTPGPQALWMKYKYELRARVLAEDPRAFLNWEVVAWTMGASIFRREYKELMGFPFWDEWRDALASLTPLYQKPYFKFPSTDGTTLFHMYSLAQMKHHFNREPRDMELIIEFGGGYGSMCALTHALGFKGEYILFDSPEFVLLQEFYLRLRGIDTSKIHFVSDIAELAKIVNGRTGFLIATWSLSETSLAFREEFVRVVNPHDYLIGYQGDVRGTDNNSYFQNFREKRPEVTWLDYPLLYHKEAGNRYLLGTTTPLREE